MSRRARSVLLVGLLLVPCCSDEQAAPDATTDASPAEGLVFADAGADGQKDGAGHDLADGRPPDAPRPDLPVDGAPPVTPDTLPAQCSLYAHFSCTLADTSCSASCATGVTTLSIACLSGTCFCMKNKGIVGTCTVLAPTGCQPCADAFACCKVHF